MAKSKSRLNPYRNIMVASDVNCSCKKIQKHYRVEAICHEKKKKCERLINYKKYLDATNVAKDCESNY